jgi:uncharacterized membrane protein
VHLADPRLFLPVMPPFIPQPFACIILSGMAELLGALGLLVPRREIQSAAGWGLLLLLVAVFPANIYMAAAHVRVRGFPQHDWMSWARLPLQPILMFAVSWSTGIWPRAGRTDAARLAPAS